VLFGSLEIRLRTLASIGIPSDRLQITLPARNTGSLKISLRTVCYENGRHTCHYGWRGARIWMAGQGAASDPEGHLYVITGNGEFDGTSQWGERHRQVRSKLPREEVEGARVIGARIDWAGAHGKPDRWGRELGAVGARVVESLDGLVQ
jgi:hypothetical protein